LDARDVVADRRYGFFKFPLATAGNKNISTLADKEFRRDEADPLSVGLSDEDMADIEARLAGIEVTGERLPPALLKATYR